MNVLLQTLLEEKIVMNFICLGKEFIMVIVIVMWTKMTILAHSGLTWLMVPWTSSTGLVQYAHRWRRLVFGVQLWLHFTWFLYQWCNAVRHLADWTVSYSTHGDVSTDIPITENHRWTLSYSLWRTFGETILVKSNLNYWLKCSPRGGNSTMNRADFNDTNDNDNKYYFI